MRWSKLKKTIEGRMAKSLQSRVKFYNTSYRNPDFLGRTWISLDGEEIVKFFCKRDPFSLSSSTPGYAINSKVKREVKKRTSDKLIEKNEFCDSDLSKCMGESLNMTIKEMVNHESPIIQMLGIIDKRMGKRSLLKLENSELHPLPLFFLELRIKNEITFNDKVK